VAEVTPEILPVSMCSRCKDRRGSLAQLVLAQSAGGVETLRGCKGIVVSYETIRRWGWKFGPSYARQMRRKKSSRRDIWHLDEVVISIGGRKHWLWRAVDQDGYVLDEIVQTRRNTKAAKRLLIRLLKKQGLAPRRIITDKLI
jgi:transposase-like protein